MTHKSCAYAFDALLAVMPAPAAIAGADPSDADFTSYLDSHGIHLGTASQTVNMARVMCQDLDAGYSHTDEVDQLTGAHRLSQPHAQLFVGAATSEYCPGHHSPNRPRGK
jgi:Protein of unknown function (DUF732)